MSKVFFKYPSIRQFREVAMLVQTRESNMVQRFIRTTKIHGANGAIVLNLKTNELYAQSRNRIITPENDSMGFAKYVEKHKDTLIKKIKDFYKDVTNEYHTDSYIAIYGEWCGESIQKNVAVNQLEKMFVVFDAVLMRSTDIPFEDEEYDGKINLVTYAIPNNNSNWALHEPDIRMFNVNEFGFKVVDIDFTDALKAQESLLKDVEEVDVQCPVGTYFNVTGAGEGHVYTSLTNAKSFKIKGEKHKVTKTKFMTPEEAAEIAEASKFASAVTTENRLQQGMDYLAEMNHNILDNTSIGVFVKWVVMDVMKEEGDYAEELELDKKKVGKCVSKIAKNFFLVQQYEETISGGDYGNS